MISWSEHETGNQILHNDLPNHAFRAKQIGLVSPQYNGNALVYTELIKSV